MRQPHVKRLDASLLLRLVFLKGLVLSLSLLNKALLGKLRNLQISLEATTSYLVGDHEVHFAVGHRCAVISHFLEVRFGYLV